MNIGDFMADNGGRKFIYGVLVSIFAFILAFLGKISYQELIGFIEWIFGLFVAGNVAQKFAVTPTDDVK
jgi:energy-coupling factor transporter transmembrane protein EcfT